MTLPPQKLVSLTELRRLFTQGGWAERLESCNRILYNEQTASGIIGYQFKCEGKYVAVVFYTKHADGTLSNAIPHRLLINGTWHYI